jgi:secondary thiamine-phosphate synthase enzyme
VKVLKFNCSKKALLSKAGPFFSGGKMILKIKTGSKTELIDITSEIRNLVRSSSIKEGFCMLYVPHTTAAVTINESADPSVKSDILMILNKIIPWEAEYRHLEGNSPAHIKSTKNKEEKIHASNG